MKILSKAANLPKIYTNHSVRATAITLWSDAGLSNRHIMSLSGHRNENSLRSYNTRPSSQQFQLCSNVLSTALNSADQHLLPQKVTQQPDRLTPGIATCNISTQNIYSCHDEKASLPCFLVARLVKFTFIATISLTDFDFQLYKLSLSENICFVDFFKKF